MRRFALLVSFLLLPALGLAQAPAKGKAAGNPKARVTIELFSDFQCPQCKVLHEQTMRKVVQAYVATGKVYLIHRDFPLPQHQYAREAASYANAAARLGKYDAVADALYRNQESWEKTGKVFDTVAAALTIAEAQQVKRIAAEPSVNEEIERELKMARDGGLNQTPTIIVRRGNVPTPIPGFVRYERLSAYLDEQLGK